MIIPDVLINRLRKANNIAILTGAGVSAESGIKTFRDPDGLWAKFDSRELASVDGFMSNPQLVWEWYQMRVGVINDSKPNPGHFAIAEMENMFDVFALITQNVDRLHQQAGSKKVLELHGNIVENHCFSCKKPFNGETNLPDQQLPKCPECGGNIRPNVVWFGEMLPVAALNNAELAAEACDIFFTIGTSTEVYPAASLPLMAQRNGAFVVEVNPNQTSFSKKADVQLAYPSGIAMPEIVRILKEQK